MVIHSLGAIYTLFLYPSAQFAIYGFHFYLRLYYLKYNKKYLLSIGCGLLIIGYICSGVAILEHNIFLFFISRAFSGAGLSLYTTIYQILSYIDAPPGKKIAIFKWPALGYTFGYFFGISISALISSNSFFHRIYLPYFIEATLLLIMLIIATSLLNSFNCRSTYCKKTSSDYRKTKKIYFIYFFYRFANSAIIMGAPLIMLKEYHFTLHELFVYYLILSITNIIYLCFVQKRLTNRVAADTLVSIAKKIIGLSVVLFSLCLIKVGVFYICIIFICSFAIECASDYIFPSIMILANNPAKINLVGILAILASACIVSMITLHYMYIILSVFGLALCLNFSRNYDSKSWLKVTHEAFKKKFNFSH